MCNHCDAKVKLRHCLGAILIVCGLVGCATEKEWNAAPWDVYECKNDDTTWCIDPTPGVRQ